MNRTKLEKLLANKNFLRFTIAMTACIALLAIGFAVAANAEVAPPTGESIVPTVTVVNIPQGAGLCADLEKTPALADFVGTTVKIVFPEGYSGSVGTAGKSVTLEVTNENTTLKSTERYALEEDSLCYDIATKCTLEITDGDEKYNVIIHLAPGGSELPDLVTAWACFGFRSGNSDNIAVSDNTVLLPYDESHSIVTDNDGFVILTNGANAASVIGYEGTGGNITLPTTVSVGSGTAPVTKIYPYALRDTDIFTSVTVPEGYTEIGKGSLIYCKNLASISLPASLTEIKGENIFSNPDLTAINVASGNENYRDDNGVLYFTLKSDGATLSTLVKYPPAKMDSSYTIADDTNVVNNYAFADAKNLSEVNVSKNVKSIGNYAFSGCENLSKVIFDPDCSINCIGEYAFSYCPKLTDIVIPASDSFDYIPEGAFCGDKSLSSFTIPDTVKALGYIAFAGTGLTELTIPESVSHISDHCFYDCDKLGTLRTSYNLTSFGFEPFIGVDDNLTVYGDKNSAAERYFTYYGFNFISTGNEVCPIDVTGFVPALFFDYEFLVTVTVKDSSGTLVNKADAVPINGYGAYAYHFNVTPVTAYFPLEKTKDYTIEVKQPGCLPVTVTNFTYGTDTLPEIALVRGNVNNDGHINIDDLTAFLPNFRKPIEDVDTPEGHCYNFDDDFDQYINIDDLTIILQNFRKSAQTIDADK